MLLNPTQDEDWETLDVMLVAIQAFLVQVQKVPPRPTLGPQPRPQLTTIEGGHMGANGH